MKYTLGLFALAGLLLVGAGCSTTTTVDTDGMDSAAEEAMLPTRMVDFHNNYNPSYDFTFDGANYTVYVAPQMLSRATQNDFVTVNDQEVYLKRNSDEEVVMSMIWVKEDGATVASAEEALGLSNGIDITFGDIDARLYEGEDGAAGMADFVILGVDGYYHVDVMHASARSVAESLSF